MIPASFLLPWGEGGTTQGDIKENIAKNPLVNPGAAISEFFDYDVAVRDQDVTDSAIVEGTLGVECPATLLSGDSFPGVEYHAGVSHCHNCIECILPANRCNMSVDNLFGRLTKQMRGLRQKCE